MTTGPAHWETLARGRALDNQVPILFEVCKVNIKRCNISFFYLEHDLRNAIKYETAFPVQTLSPFFAHNIVGLL